MTSSGRLSYAYDSNGNLATKTEGADTWTYEWNADNELTRVLKNAAEQSRFSYDPFGRRVQKVAGGTTTDYTYEGFSILREAHGGTVLTYVHGPDVDEPLALDDGSASTYLQADGLGSVAVSTSAVGAVTLVRQYDAWGNLLAGASQGGFAFTGREWDPETELYYYRAREYDPRLGRFISEDPIRFWGGRNFYEYVRDNPIAYTDPDGLQLYQCHRPMRFGSKKAKAIPHALLYSMKCKQSYSFGPVVPPAGMGHVDPDENPFDPSGKAKPEYQCTLESSNKCVEDCVCKRIQRDVFNPNLRYGLGPKWGPGYQCNDAVDDVLLECRFQCR